MDIARGTTVFYGRARTSVDAPHLLCKQEVVGSIPISSTENRRFRQLVTFEHSTLGSRCSAFRQNRERCSRGQLGLKVLRRVSS
jgi:hypothetical protein